MNMSLLNAPFFVVWKDVSSQGNFSLFLVENESQYAEAIRIRSATILQLQLANLTFASFSDGDWHTVNMKNNSKLGFVHDPTAVRRQNKSFSISDDEFGKICAEPGMGPEGPEAYDVIVEKIKVANDTSNNIKVFCSIYTHKGGNDRVTAIRETWGKRCDGFMAASTYTQPEEGTVNILHQGIPGAYRSIWQKVRSMYAYIYANYLDDYDFYYFSGDDVFLIVENLKAFLASEPVVQASGGSDYPIPFYTGGWTIPSWLWRKNPNMERVIYAGGGPGYVLSRSALKLFVENGLMSCDADKQDSPEDLHAGTCLKKVLNASVYNASDESGAFRFHHLDPHWAVSFQPGMRIDKKLNPNSQRSYAFLRRQRGLLLEHGIPFKLGFDQVSESSISFHILKSPVRIRRFEKILYRKDISDCSCNGEKEPGHIRQSNGDNGVRNNTVGHIGCHWDSGLEYLAHCPSYDALSFVARPKC